MISITYGYFTLDFEEIWMIAPAQLRIRGCGPAPAAAQALGGFTTKATMSFRINKMAFKTARYRGLRRSRRGKKQKKVIEDFSRPVNTGK